jgi:hypothetical protein
MTFERYLAGADLNQAAELDLIAAARCARCLCVLLYAKAKSAHRPPAKRSSCVDARSVASVLV